MTKKTTESVQMGGEQDADYKLRISTALKDRIKAAAEVGIGTDAAKVMRFLAVPYCDFVEKNRRQPSSFSELAEWHLSVEKKDKKKR